MAGQETRHWIESVSTPDRSSGHVDEDVVFHQVVFTGMDKNPVSRRAHNHVPSHQAIARIIVEVDRVRPGVRRYETAVRVGAASLSIRNEIEADDMPGSLIIDLIVHPRVDGARGGRLLAHAANLVVLDDVFSRNCSARG